MTERLEQARIFTIGHSTHPLEEFLRLLGVFDVGQVADVRRFPGSRRVPWFNHEVLAAELPSRGLLYVHLPALGGRRRPSPDTSKRGWQVEAFRGYADHMSPRNSVLGSTALECVRAAGHRRDVRRGAVDALPPPPRSDALTSADGQSCTSVPAVRPQPMS